MSVCDDRDELRRDASRHSSVERGFAVLQAIGTMHGPAGLAQIARRAKLPKTTAHRLLAALVACGAVSRVGDRYEVGATVRQLGAQAGQPALVALRRAAKPVLVDLYEMTRGIAALSIARGVLIQQLDVVHGHALQALANRYGEFAPLRCTAPGKAMLAFHPGLAASIDVSETAQYELAATRARGLAVVCGEYRRGVVEMAAPVLGGDGCAIGAVSVIGTNRQVDWRRAPALLRDAAANAQRALRRTG